APCGRALRLKIVNANLVGSVQVASWLGKQRGDMTSGALCLAIENVLPTNGGEVERIIGFGRIRRRDGELVEMKCCQLGSNEIRTAADVARAGLDRDPELLDVVQSWIVKCSLSVH